MSKLRLVVLCAALAGACGRRTLEPIQSSSPACAIDSTWKGLLPRPGPPPFDERVAFAVPQYAGIARDTGALGQSSLVVTLTDLGSARKADSVIRRERGREILARTRFVQVTYSYRQLRSWLECYLRGSSAGGLTAFGVSTRLNRVALGVAADSLRPAVAANIRRLGLPLEAFDIQVEVVRLP